MVCPNCTGHLGTVPGGFLGFIWNKGWGWHGILCPCICSNPDGLMRSDAYSRAILLIPDNWPLSTASFEEFINGRKSLRPEDLELPPNAPDGLRDRLLARFAKVDELMLENIRVLCEDVRRKQISLTKSKPTSAEDIFNPLN